MKDLGFREQRGEGRSGVRRVRERGTRDEGRERSALLIFSPEVQVTRMTDGRWDGWGFSLAMVWYTVCRMRAKES